MPHDRFDRRSRKPGRSPQRGPVRSASALRLRSAGQGEFELLHPRCALERADDLDEVRQMIAAGEIEIAIDELRWLLSGCHDFIDAHRLLGELALADDDLALARGHFGIAYQLGTKAAGNFQGTLPYRLAGNQSFHESGKGLVWCLSKLGKRDLAQEVAGALLRLDPADPLGIGRLLAELSAANQPTAAPHAKGQRPYDR